MENKSMTLDEFKRSVKELTSNITKYLQQEVQNLANEACNHARATSDFTFFTVLYNAIPDGVQSNKLKLWAELYGGCLYESAKGKSKQGQFKKNHAMKPDPVEGQLATNAWFLLKPSKEERPFDVVAFFNRHAKTIGNKGSDDLFNPMDDSQQQAVDLLIRAIKNEGFNISDPRINPMAHEELRAAA